MNINPYLDEWIMVRRPLSRSECIALLEESTLKKRLSKLETMNYILMLLNGFDSDLFIWNDQQQSFQLTYRYAMNNVNSGTLRIYLRKFIPYGSMYRQMWNFTEKQHFSGKTVCAFQNILRHILIEIMNKTLSIRDKFMKTVKNTNDENIRLSLFESYLDSEPNGNLLLSLKNLYSIFCQSTKDTTALDNAHQLCIQSYPYNCQQILNALHCRLIIPDKRIQSLSYTMLNYSLRPLFISIESMLKHFSSIAHLKTNEFLFISMFSDDDQLYYTSFMPNEIIKFWSDFVFIDDRFKSMPLFKFESLNLLIEAIKCSFSLRKNSLNPQSLLSINILKVFQSKFKHYIQKYSHEDEVFDVENDYRFITNKIPQPDGQIVEEKVKQFKTYELALLVRENMQDIFSYALNDTFEFICRPIVQEFLPEFRIHYKRLFDYYCNFYLVKNGQHIVYYMHFLFPHLKEHLLMAKNRQSFSNLEQILRNIHDSLQNHSQRDDDNGLSFFIPHLSYQVHQQEHKDESDIDWIVRSFDSFYYLPSFGNDWKTFDSRIEPEIPFYDFWPIGQMFNSRVTDLFNQVFQFLIRIRYFQFLIGNDFQLSSRFRSNGLDREIYLFRFRLSNLIIKMGYNIEYNLNELIQHVQSKFNNANTMKEFFMIHQNFLKRIQQIHERVSQSNFIQSQFKTIVKFCNCNLIARSLSNPLRETDRKKRKNSILENICKLDQVAQDDFII